ncbi:MAG: biopolymer transporter ExbD [Planctomycetaceae bacterium]|nr:biopolymer transporter ExbD [Planctomycetaceae bacterium]
MRVPSLLRSGEVGFNMTPMIDVVFLLIIFFLVSSHLAKQEAQMELPLPVADSGEEPNDELRRVTLNVTSDGTMLLAGRRIDRDELKQRLKEARNEHGDDVEIRIRGDRSVPYSSVSPIMLSCARAGIWKVTFGVYRSEDVR